MGNYPIPQLLSIKSDLLFPEYSLKNECYDQKTESFPFSFSLVFRITRKNTSEGRVLKVSDLKYVN
jgi:hypothetical protein